MPQRIRDFGVAALAITAVIAALAFIDERVPEYLRDLSTDVVDGRALQAGSPLGNVFTTLTANPALENIFVIAMVAVGAVLFLLMLRT